MGKLVSWVAVILLLVVVPLGSWYYLNQGLNYRKTALSELHPKDSISLHQDTLNLLKDRTTLVVLDKNNTSSIIDAVGDQFKNAQGFQVLHYDSTSTSDVIPFHYSNGFFDTKQGYAFVLIDQDLKIRNFYKGDMVSVKRMIEHIAMVIPRPKEADIKQKQ